MEDPERGMATTTPKGPTVRGRPNRKDKATVMIVGSVGKVRSFSVSRGFIFKVSLFFFFYIILSILIINDYLQLRRRSDTQSQKIEALEKEVLKGSADLLKTKQYAALLKDFIGHMEERQEREPTKVQDLKGSAPPQQMERREGEKQAIRKSPAPVEIQEMVIQKEGNRMTIHFRLVNIQQGDDPMGGYIHIIAIGRKGGPSQEWAYPKEELRNGMPVNYRNGQPFLIQKFKTIQGKFQIAPNSESPSSIRVVVYDQAGNIVLEREFEGSHVS